MCARSGRHLEIVAVSGLALIEIFGNRQWEPLGDIAHMRAKEESAASR